MGDLEIPGLFNYWIVFVLMTIGFYTVMAHENLVKKVIGLNIFQAAVFVFYISMSKVDGGSAPIIADGITVYSNPLPHVLILTAIVVGVATTALALALIVRIRDTYGTVEDREIRAIEAADRGPVARDAATDDAGENETGNDDAPGGASAT